MVAVGAGPAKWGAGAVFFAFLPRSGGGNRRLGWIGPDQRQEGGIGPDRWVRRKRFGLTRVGVFLCKTTGCRGSARIGNAFAVSGGGRSAQPHVLIGQAVQRLPAPGRPSGALSAHAPKPRSPTRPRPARRAARPRQRRTCASGVAWGIVWGGGERAPGGLPGLQNQWGCESAPAGSIPVRLRHASGGGQDPDCPPRPATVWV